MKGKDALLAGLLLGLLTLGCFAGSASAATVAMRGSTLDYNAAYGERNLIDIWTSDGQYFIKDKTLRSMADMDGNGGCSVVGNNLATCPANLNLSINAGDDNDSVRVRSINFNAPGIDRILGGAGNDHMRGPSGDKVPYRNILRLDGGTGYDTIAGAGTADYSGRNDPVSVTLSRRRDDGAVGERDSISTDSVIGGSSKDILVGSSRNDAIWGGSQADTIDGGFGNDFVDGDNGPDTLVGGFDHDAIAARDGVVDTSIDCGYGDDSVVADSNDPVVTGIDPGCEHVDMLGAVFPPGP